MNLQGVLERAQRQWQCRCSTALSAEAAIGMSDRRREVGHESGTELLWQGALDEAGFGRKPTATGNVLPNVS